MNLRRKISFILVFALAPLACFASQDPPLSGAGSGSQAATITFLKIFKSSYPEYVQIKVSESGAGTFDIRQLDDSPNPQPLNIGPEVAQKIFQLASELHDFEGVQLEAHRRIANLGQKTLTYEKGGQSHEVTFNYTGNNAANELLNIFEGIAREEADISDLQRTMRYDPLGVNDVLLQVQSDYKQKLLPDPRQLLPSLDAIAKNDQIINIARDKARNLAGQIRNERSN
ncbi:MAG TPA: hypothetical protein VGR36_10075 [Candidatus Acidoferrales bacterium]|nr:hypothetical protein [Candidatus Acidoferrales bacterium]